MLILRLTCRAILIRGARYVKTFKIYVPSVPPKLMLGELKNILIAGIKSNSSTELCHCLEEADYIFLDFRHCVDGLYEITHPDKTIIIDYQDDPQFTFPDPSLLYFKRSVVDTRDGSFVNYARDITPISYCVKDEYLNRSSQFSSNRDIDIAIFFDPAQPPGKARNHYRSLVTQFIKNTFGELNTFVGIAGKNGEIGRSEFQSDYFDIMTRSKIVVTCNPDLWEGDYRLFEALSSGSLVLIDRMITPVENPFIDWEHLVYYDRNQLGKLGNTIKELLANDAVRSYIANNGYEHAMNYHTASNRISEILLRARCLPTSQLS